MLYLIQFRWIHVEFIEPELRACLKLLGVDAEKALATPIRIDISNSPFALIDLESDDIALRLAGRCVLIKGIYKFWATGRTHEEVANEAVKVLETSPDLHNQPTLTFSLRIESFGIKLSESQQEEIRTIYLPATPKCGKVRLKKPDHKFLILIEPDNSVRDEDAFRAARFPIRIFYGEFLSDGAARRATELDLKKRAYLGPTSLEAELSLLMANQGLARPGSIVMDTFGGTGSLLVAAASLGATTLGCDIDLRVIRGKQGRTIQTNFDQYNLGMSEMLRMDNAKNSMRNVPWIDAIITDPPYGVRAGARKSGTTEAKSSKTKEKLRQREERTSDDVNAQLPDVTARVQQYDADDLMDDLLDNAARLLKLGGRLVYLFPCTYEFNENELPMHPCLRLVCHSEQKLRSQLARRCVTMEKNSEYDTRLRNQYKERMRTYRQLHGVTCETLEKRLKAQLDETDSRILQIDTDASSRSATKNMNTKDNVTNDINTMENVNQTSECSNNASVPSDTSNTVISSVPAPARAVNPLVDQSAESKRFKKRVARKQRLAELRANGAFLPRKQLTQQRRANAVEASSEASSAAKMKKKSTNATLAQQNINAADSPVYNAPTSSFSRKERPKNLVGRAKFDRPTELDKELADAYRRADIKTAETILRQLGRLPEPSQQKIHISF